MAGALFALGACGESVGGPEPHGTILTIDARPLLQPSPNGDGPFQGPLVSVLDRAELTVTPDVSVLSAPLTAEEPTATFEVQVPAGLRTFFGRVLSNNGTVLYEGSRDVQVRADGFAVELDLVPVAPVLAVEPDSISVVAESPPVVPDAFRVANVGSETLEWWVDPPVTPCDGGLTLRPETGRITVDQRSVFLAVETDVCAEGDVYRVQLGSPVGSVELKVYVEPEGR